MSRGHGSIRESTSARVLFFAVTAAALALVYAPAFYVTLASFNPGLQFGLVAPADFSLKWYLALLDDRRLGFAIRESLLVAIPVALIAMPLGLAAALAYREFQSRRGWWFLFILFSVFVPGAIHGLGVAVVLKALAIKPFWATVAIGHLIWALPFCFTVSLVSLGGVKASYVAAARDLGATWFQAFAHVTYPLIRTGLASSGLFAFLLSLNEYARAYYLVGRQNTLPIQMFGLMNAGTTPKVYALSGALLVGSLLLLALIAALLSGRSKSGE